MLRVIVSRIEIDATHNRTTWYANVEGLPEGECPRRFSDTAKGLALIPVQNTERGRDWIKNTGIVEQVEVVDPSATCDPEFLRENYLDDVIWVAEVYPNGGLRPLSRDELTEAAIEGFELSEIV